MPEAPRHDGPGLYLHVPFCSAICPYCDFSVLTGGETAHRRFVDTLLAEAELWREDAHRLAPGRFDTLYLGGGTPSALAPAELARLLDGVAARLPLRSDVWIFLEANPEDVDRRSLDAWRDLGVRTLSLGVQSFDPASLAFLGRRHDPATARRSVGEALATGFHTVSVDLIFGLPRQGSASWGRDLDTLVELSPQHLSCYQLTIHEGTPFGFRARRGELAELAEDAQGELYAQAHEVLAAAGWSAYEVSSFARSPEHHSRHNRKYWRHVPYLGLGPSAHSFELGAPGRARRWWNERKLGAWTRRVEARDKPLAGEEGLAAEQLALEAVFLGLRTAAGLDLEAVRRRWGVDLAALNRERFAAWVEAGFVDRAGGVLRPTPRGLAVADGLAASVELGGSDVSR
ncbi:MAG: radical SAM family heme chaperone HemW [Acidobacteria bacterium]|nr:radical SAM family heme chaperone HemW [Acidobacteriota bacterium]